MKLNTVNKIPLIALIHATSLDFKYYVTKYLQILYLASHSMRTKLSKTQGRGNLPQQCDHIDMLNPSLGIGIIFRPQSDKLIQVMWSQNGPISSQVVKVVHDDGDEEIEDEKGTDDEEGDEVRIGEVGAASGRITGVFRFFVAYN